MPCSFLKDATKETMTTTFMLIQVHLDYHLKLGSNLKICSLLKLICKVMLMQDQPDCNFFSISRLGKTRVWRGIHLITGV